MLMGRIPDHTSALGKSQGYLTLFIRERTLPGGFPVMDSAWTPTPDELARLNAGASVILSVVGTAHPPVMITVGEVPE